jgi:hypothetical protein
VRRAENGLFTTVKARRCANDQGAIIALEVIVRGFPVNHAEEKFQSFARHIFSHRPRRKTRLGQSWDLFCNWLADGRYDSGALDATLKEAFDGSRHLFDVTPRLPSGSRVALTASHVEKKGMLSLFSNYRCSGRPDEQVSYESIMPKEVDQEPLLWEVSVSPLSSIPSPSRMTTV